MTSTVLLCSGGLDSTAVAHMIRPSVALFVDHGQNALNAERRASQSAAHDVGASFDEQRVHLRAVQLGETAGGTALADSPTPEWFPFRNQLLITVAAIVAASAGAQRIAIGITADDRIRHLDGSAEFVENIGRLVKRQERGIEVVAPAIDLEATELIERSGIDERSARMSFSCHRADLACGRCSSCVKRAAALDAVYQRGQPST